MTGRHRKAPDLGKGWASKLDWTPRSFRYTMYGLMAVASFMPMRMLGFVIFGGVWVVAFLGADYLYYCQLKKEQAHAGNG